MRQVNHLSHFNLKIEGRQAPTDLIDKMLECVVENSLHLPDVCTIRIHDAAFTWLDSTQIGEGKSIEVLAAGEQGSLKRIFFGEIAGVEMDLVAHGVPTLVVRCYDKSHRLHRGRFSRAFVQMTDADIVKKVGKEADLDVKADATGQVHEWVMQNNQTNWEFLNERASRNGYRLYVEGERTLHFKKVSNQADGEAELEWGNSLRSFRPRTAVSTQVDEVVVRGWDQKKKQAIVGKAKSPAGIPNIGNSRTGGEAAKKAFGPAKMMVCDRPVHTEKEAEDLARSICDHIGGSYLEAEGLCYGQPTLKPGMQVKVKNLGKRFSGSYYVTSTTHTYTVAEGYTTQFSVTGKQPSSLLGSLDGRGDENSGPSRMRLGGNVVVGIVTDNNDPDGLGRVKVKYPWLTEEHTSWWARIASPMAGANRGFYYLPEINDEVLVAFEHGDIRRPYVLGALWNQTDKPVEANSKAVTGGKVNRRTIKTRIGHTFLFDDTDGKGEISFKTCNGHFLTMDDKNQNITAVTKSGHKVFLDDKGNQIIVVDKSGNNKMTIKTDDNSIAMECNGNFSVMAKGKVSIEGKQGIELTTPMQLKADAKAGLSMETNANMDLKAKAMMNVEGTGPTTVKSSAILTVQGSLVKIN